MQLDTGQRAVLDTLLLVWYGSHMLGGEWWQPVTRIRDWDQLWPLYPMLT